MKPALAMFVLIAACNSKPDDCAAFQTTIARLSSSCPTLARDLAGATKQLDDLRQLVAVSGGEGKAPPELLDSVHETCKSQNASLVALGCPK